MAFIAWKENLNDLITSYKKLIHDRVGEVKLILTKGVTKDLISIVFLTVEIFFL